MNQDSRSKKCSCSGVLKKTRLSKTIPIAGRRVEVENVEGFVCETCGEVFFDGPTLLKLESKLLKQPALT
jgi:YgiT-type zinc finger domain-containing protein